MSKALARVCPNSRSISAQATGSIWFGMARPSSSWWEAAPRSARPETSRRRNYVGGTTRSARKAGSEMPLTRSLKETVQARAQADPEFREALLTEGLEAFLSGDLETGKAIIRDYINATIGFDNLATVTGTPSKSLMRMFGPSGNPNARNLLTVIGQLQKSSGLSINVGATRKGPIRRKAPARSVV